MIHGHQRLESVSHVEFENVWNACVFSFKLSYDSGRILKYLSGLLPHELSLFSCLSLTHIFKTSGLLISNISELNSVHRNNTSVRQESFNHLAFNKYYFTSEISMSGSFQLCFYLIIEQTFCPPKKILKIPKLLKLDLTSNSKPDIRSVHLVSLEEG